MTVVLYTTHCPKCKVLQTKLEQKGIEYSTVEDMEQILAFGKEHNIKSAPILSVDGVAYQFKEACDWVKEN